MKRKVVKHGASTLTLSLPSRWAKNNNIRSGDNLNIETSNDHIIISTSERHFEAIETTLTGDEEWFITRILRHLYTSGYDEIKINYQKTEQLELVRKAITTLTGIEIVESKPGFCILKCVISSDNLDYHNIVERMLWLTLSQFDYFLEDSKEGKPKMYNEVFEIHRTILKLNNMCRREINKKPLYNSIISKYVYWFLTSLLNISSFVLYCYDYSKKTDKIKLSEKELDLVIKTRDFFYILLLAYKNLNLEKTRDFFEKREALFDEVLEILKDKNPVITHYFLDILKEMSSLGNLIIALKVNEKKPSN
jgi:phosphate uptake regulator